MNLYYDEMESPIGPIVIISRNGKLIRIDFGSWDELSERLTNWISIYSKEFDIIHKPEAFKKVKHQLQDYFERKRQTFSIDFDFYGTSFQKKVWQALSEIPFGNTRSYQDIAIAIGNPKAVRAVGGAVNKNPLSIVVPCHRVIGKNGKMVGYNGGIDKKEFLLQLESSFVFK